VLSFVEVKTNYFLCRFQSPDLMNAILPTDLRQLKPVCAAAVYTNLSTEFGDVVGNPIWEAFKSYELTEIMRQKDDRTFAEALNRLSR